MSDQPSKTPPEKAHLAICYGCENSVLARDLCKDTAAMKCPRCGTYIRPSDLNTYVLEEATDE